MHKALHIGVAGLGTVGASVIRILQDEADQIAARAGRPIKVSHIAARDRSIDRGFNADGLTWWENPVADILNSDIDVLVEVIGGVHGIAYDLVKTALENGISVVTANKAMLAEHGAALAALAEDHNAHLKFEAAVAGAIPIIKSVREGLSANKITSVYGILNGTCNFILTQMQQTGGDFSEILQEAQNAGYAEADPSFDIDGIDTAHKTALLAAVAFNVPPHFANMPVRGIRDMTQTDIMYADDLGYKIKLLGVAKKTALGIEQSVEPCLVQADTPLAAVDGSLNAVYCESSYAHETLMVGRGAGGDPTASAVIADLVDIARDIRVPAFGQPVRNLNRTPMADMSEHIAANYIRVIVEDKPGVFADIAGILRDAHISIKSALQLNEIDSGLVPVILLTHTAKTRDLDAAVKKIETLAAVKDKPFTMRIIEQES